jgi:hypothetical protein
MLLPLLLGRFTARETIFSSNRETTARKIDRAVRSSPTMPALRKSSAKRSRMRGSEASAQVRSNPVESEARWRATGAPSTGSGEVAWEA